jgi:hypothetical protein
LLALAKRKEGPEAEVILLVYDKVTMEMVNNVIGILSKTGCVAPPGRTGRAKIIAGQSNRFVIDNWLEAVCTRQR